MVVLSGADLVCPEGVQRSGTLVLDGDRIADVTTGGFPTAAAEHHDLHNHLIVPGFIDVHVHGVAGIDTLDGPEAVAGIAERLPMYGVTAFCPTTVACSPAALRQVLSSVGELRGVAGTSGARVLPAHLESNFINPEYKGAQPAEWICGSRGLTGPKGLPDSKGLKADILAEIDRAGANVGIVTLAPELDGSIELIRALVAKGTRVSLGHSGATFEEAHEAIAAGARRATHLFNRMRPLAHREPGLVGAVLTCDDVVAELICDGVHVHPAMIRLALAAKRVRGVMAITDGTAAAGLPDGHTALLGGRRVTVSRSAAYLDDGTLAGSIATMDRVYKFLVETVGLSLDAASHLCSTTPAAELGLSGLGSIVKGSIADLVVLDREFRVKQTYVGGRLVYR